MSCSRFHAFSLVHLKPLTYHEKMINWSLWNNSWTGFSYQHLRSWTSE